MTHIKVLENWNKSKILIKLTKIFGEPKALPRLIFFGIRLRRSFGFFWFSSYGIFEYIFLEKLWKSYINKFLTKYTWQYFNSKIKV